MASHLVPGDPAHERFDAVVRALVTGALAATGAVLVAGVLGWAGSPLGWALLAVAVLAALVPVARWRRTAARSDRLPVGHLEPAWRDVLDRAASAVERIDATRAAAPPGAVAEHLDRLHEHACHHLRALHATATAAAGFDGDGGRALLDEQELTVRRLGELADSAERLRAAQSRQLGPDPLAALVEATDHLAASLDPPAPARDPEPDHVRWRTHPGAGSA